MEAATHRRLLSRVQHELEHGVPPVPAFAIPAARYRDVAHHERELAAFRSPRVIAASSQLARGACLPIDLPGRSLLVTRDADGIARGFANACRHRASRLVDIGGAAKAVVCPYHGWTYDLRGTLVHAPHAQTFGTHCEHRDLHAMPVTERHGLIWAGDGIAEFLGPLDADLAALRLEASTVYRSVRAVRRCNWKLVIEAFLDGYHVRILHRDSVYRFFLDAASAAESVAPHIRAVTGRKALRADGRAPGELPLHELGTPSYLVFPSTVMIEHPDFLSVLNIVPLAPDACMWEHLMLVPAARAGETEHWDKSWALIEETVFEKEDLWVCEQIQRGIAAGATEELLFGSLELAVQWFHQALGY